MSPKCFSSRSNEDLIAVVIERKAHAIKKRTLHQIEEILTPVKRSTMEIQSIQDSVIKNKNLMMKRRYGEVVGNVVQERQRRYHSKAGASSTPSVSVGMATQLGSTRMSRVKNPSLGVASRRPSNGGLSMTQRSGRESQSPNVKQLQIQTMQVSLGDQRPLQISVTPYSKLQTPNVR